jgi:hypothetical protein
MRPSLRNQCPPDGGSTIHTRLAGALVDAVLELEEAAPAFGVHIVGNRGPAFLDGLRQHFHDGVVQALDALQA